MVGLTSWAALSLAAMVLANLPVATLLPLLVLETTFEIVFVLHTGVERVGRYIQVFFEEPGERGWEHVAMQYGRQFGGGGSIDALFSPLFWTATIVNLIPLLTSGPAAIDWAVVGVVHALFILRVWMAKRQSARQRATDLGRFERIRAELRT
jgi:hypothetical protein